MPNTPDDDRRITAVRALAIDMVQQANSGHPGLPLGAAPLAYTLFTRHLVHDPRDPHWFNRDRFILSAGHGSALLYALLYLSGYDLSLDDLRAFRQFESRTPGHPEFGFTPGVDVTTGPLGQGLANAVGFAIAESHLAARYNRAQRIVDHYTYVLCSDGDLMEGVTSEASSLAGHLGLGKLIALYDDNHISLAGPTAVAFSEDVLQRYEAYGWHVARVERADANDVEAIDRAIREAQSVTDRPSIIAVCTTIGYGSPLADTFKAHGEPLGAENVAKTKAALHWDEPAFGVPRDILDWWRENGARHRTTHATWRKTFATWQEAEPQLAATFERIRTGGLPTDIAWPTFTEENGSIASREAGGLVMNAVATQFPELVGGSADLDPSTKTYLKGAGDYTPQTPEGRNIHFGVREHAMMAAVNGIALHGGTLPFGATFFNFVDYCKPAIRLAALSKLRSIFIFTHDSVFLGEDGPTHQPIEQLAGLRATPNLTTIRPADSVETLAAWRYLLEGDRGASALVLSRQKLPFLGARQVDIGRGAYVLHEPSQPPQMIFIATGSEVSLALAAAKQLAEQRIAARVVSMPSMELFAAQDAAYRESVLPPSVTARVSIEAAATLGWHRWVGDHGLTIGIDHFGMSAPAAAIANALGLTPEAIVKQSLDLLTRTTMREPSTV